MSEFGRGYAYCLGLFLAHEMEFMAQVLEPHMWLCAAADHLSELEIPHTFPDDKKAEIEAWKDNALEKRLSNDISLEECLGMCLYAKNLLLEWDIFCGIAAEKGEWQ